LTRSSGVFSGAPDPRVPSPQEKISSPPDFFFARFEWDFKNFSTLSRRPGSDKLQNVRGQLAVACLSSDRYALSPSPVRLKQAP